MAAPARRVSVFMGHPSISDKARMPVCGNAVAQLCRGGQILSPIVAREAGFRDETGTARDELS
jgi:hypothetical protein